MDRFMACGSKRPSLIADKSIALHLPSWSPSPAALPIEGEFFQNGSNLQYHSGSGKKSQGSTGMLIDIVRILGITNRYLAAGGVKGDSHFPWHSLSNLSKIRQDLDIWASGTQDVFSSVDTLFGQPDSTTLVLSKLIYHLIHCLIYRPFLPIDLAELAGTGQHQSWQIEATNLCFLHANAIAELVELGKQSAAIEWPAFVGYCICTAGTVHVHGAHYKGGQQGEVFSASAEFLSREMQQLNELRYAWSSVQHQRETLQTIYGCHSELVKSLASNPMRYSPVFHLEDFFDRYSDLGKFFDGAHISFADVVHEGQEFFQGHDIYSRSNLQNESLVSPTTVPNKHRKSSAAAARKKEHLKIQQQRHALSNGNGHHAGAGEGNLVSPSTNGAMMNGENGNGNGNGMLQQQSLLDSTPLSPFPPNGIPAPFSPPYAYNALALPTHASVASPITYDPMFSMPSLPGSVHGGTYAGNFGLDGSAQANGNSAVTPSGRSSGTNEGAGEGEEKDPFLSLLEQLAENEHSRGGPSELDFFLSGGNG